MKDLFLTTTKDKTLRLLQELETGALVEVDRICRKYNIDYSLGGGTCLGQVRHGGFIPWDDDIDVDMTIDQYERFLEVAPAELEGTNYHLLSRTTDPTYKRSHSRIAVKDTVLNLRSNVMNGINREVFIDVFCWNYLPENKTARKVVTSLLFYIRCAIKYNDTGMLEPTLSPRGRNAVRDLCRKFSYEKLVKMEYRLNHLYKERTGWFMEDVTVKGNFGGYPSEGMDEYKDVVFDGHTVRSKLNTETFLTTLYGKKYNEWLPPQKRLSVHSWYQIDLGHYAEEAGLPDDYRECFTNAYTREKLELMKQLSYHMVERVAEICRDHGWKYYLMGYDMIFKALDAEELAKLWRQPVKVAMPLTDYDEFRKVCQKELGERYFFMDYRDDSGFFLTHGRVGLNYTYMREVFMPIPLTREFNTGFYIKIVPLAFTADDKEERMQHRKRLNQLKDLSRLRWFKFYKVNKSRKDAVKRAMMTFSGTRDILKKFDEQVNRYSDTGWLIDGSSGELHRMAVPKEYFGEGTECEWDGRKFIFPDEPRKVFDAALSKSYRLTEKNGKKAVERLVAATGEVSDVISEEFDAEEMELIRSRYDNCLLHYYDLPECQLTVLRYDEKTGRLLSNEELLGPERPADGNN